MQIDSQHSLYISSQITYKNDLAYHRKFHIKYAKLFNVASPLELREKREWYLFFRRMKILRKINCPSNHNSALEPSLPFIIEAMKGKKSLISFPIKLKFSQGDGKVNKFLACKLLKCLTMPKELSICFQGKIDKVSSPVINYLQLFTKTDTLKIQFNAPTLGSIDISKEIKILYKILNRLGKLNLFSLHFQDIHVSDNSLTELFHYYRLKKPPPILQILSDRLLDIEDEYDDFTLPTEDVNNSLEKLWKGFCNIESLADTLIYLHIQPLLRNASDHCWLRYFFVPLAKLQKLNTLKIEMPNIELSEDDSKALSTSLSCLRNLRVLRILAQFGMITQRALDGFFCSYYELNLLEMDLQLTFSTMLDYSGFFRAVSKNMNLKSIKFEMTYLANLQFDPMLCDYVFLCRDLRQLVIGATPLMKGLTPHKDRYNACFKKTILSLVHLPNIERFSLCSPKTSADNDNIRVIAESLPSLPTLKEFILDINWKEYEVDYEIGMKFWDAVLQSPKLKKLIMTALFKGAEYLLPLLRRRLESMRNLECLYANFESATLEPEQIVLFVKRIKDCGFIKELRLYFKVKDLLANRLIEKLQNILKDDKYLKKGLIQIQSANGQQSVCSESKSIFRRGQDFYYFD